jgi:hypothetical protein
MNLIVIVKVENNYFHYQDPFISTNHHSDFKVKYFLALINH